MSRILIVAGVIVAGGCGGGSAPTAGPTRAITWDEYQTLNAEQKDDPYITAHLDNDARKKLAEQSKTRRR